MVKPLVEINFWFCYIQYISMLQNKIYQNFLIEIFKSFLLILLGLSLIALTVRAVSFLDLIVENGYPVNIYFQYSVLNLFGIVPKFIPLSFLIAITLFIIKHLQDSEFIILWTSEKKNYIINLFFISSVVISLFYLVLTTFLTPLALNESRKLVGNDKFNSLLPTIKTQRFSDSFKGFTFFVERKIDNEIQNVFLYDKGNNIKNLSSNSSEINTTSIIAKNGIIYEKKLLLFNGQVITSKKDTANEIIKFEQLNIDLSNLSTTTIKNPKIQETSTLKLLKCLISEKNSSNFCREGFKEEILPTLNRRMVIPMYIPVLSLISGLLLIKSRKFYFNKFIVFLYSFSLLLFTELAVRYTGINSFVLISFIILPFGLLFLLYSFLIYKFSDEAKVI